MSQLVDSLYHNEEEVEETPVKVPKTFEERKQLGMILLSGFYIFMERSITLILYGYTYLCTKYQVPGGTSNEYLQHRLLWIDKQTYLFYCWKIHSLAKQVALSCHLSEIIYIVEHGKKVKTIQRQLLVF